VRARAQPGRHAGTGDEDRRSAHGFAGEIAGREGGDVGIAVIVDVQAADDSVELLNAQLDGESKREEAVELSAGKGAAERGGAEQVGDGGADLAGAGGGSLREALVKQLPGGNFRTGDAYAHAAVGANLHCAAGRGVPANVHRPRVAPVL